MQPFGPLIQWVLPHKHSGGFVNQRMVRGIQGESIGKCLVFTDGLSLEVHHGGDRLDWLEPCTEQGHRRPRLHESLARRDQLRTFCASTYRTAAIGRRSSMCCVARWIEPAWLDRARVARYSRKTSPLRRPLPRRIRIPCPCPEYSHLWDVRPHACITLEEQQADAVVATSSSWLNLGA